MTKSNASKEDTVPKWLQAELGIASEIVEPTLTSPTGEQLNQRIHPVDQLLTGGVCRQCNNGWMSELECAAKRILRSLITSRRRLAELTRAERHVVSRWAAKTAYMLDVGGFETTVSREHISRLFTHAPHLPDNVYVFARQQPKTRNWSYITGAWWKARLTEEAQRLVRQKSYKIGIQFGDLILIVVYWPLASWGLRVEKDKLVKLWPHSSVIKQYVYPEQPDVSMSDAACQRYTTTIGVVPHRGAEGFVPPGAQLTN